ncbi:MAG: WXG100 family type VII secretion target [Corynebacterium sp.]|nr:WXG100 family type VII secretion target [Corynebacterium sp.]
MADVFAFRDSASVTAESDILATMNEIKSILADNRKEINNLKPEWVAVEADAYYEAINQWNEGADGLADVLKNVEQILAAVRDGTGELKKSIGKILDATH